MTTWAAYEGEHRDERQRAALDEIHANREPVPGKARFGYLGADEKVGRRVNCKVDPETAPVVKAMFESIAHKDPARRRSINSWARELGWPRRRVCDTLSNPAYAGTLTRRDVQFEAAEHVDRIVTQELFDQVQDVLATHLHAGRPGGVVRHLASGIARCGVCGGPMQFRNNYLCLRDLSHPTVKGEYVDKKVTAEIVNVLLASEQDTAETVQVGALEARLRKINEEEAGWAQAQAAGMNWTLIAPHVKALLSERQRLQEERKNLMAASVRQRLLAELREAVIDPVTRRASMAAAGELRNEVRRRFEGLPIEERRELVTEHLDIVVHPGRGPGRVQITHKIFVELNDGVTVEEELFS
ncbi:recombinase family protein [Microbacterium testaceum]|uniref:recombinase family protein n=1 Tax=Microbacterium testaceum TaxID=2033 RepID=UPI0021CB4A18|nr:recombinase family protein [Microbacterium testaceum]